MIKGKKGIQQIIIALFVVISIGAVLVMGSNAQNVLTKIGDKQTLLLSAYAQAEQVRDYYVQIARLATIDAAKELDMSLRPCIMAQGDLFDAKFLEKVKDYKEFDISANPRLAVSAPKVEWSVEKYADAASIYGKPNDAVSNNIIVSGEDFQYEAGFFVNYTFCQAVCDDGFKQGAEECDGGDLGGRSCGDYRDPSGNPYSGNMKCTADCKLDTSDCGYCGDGKIQRWELCDSTEFGGKTCSTEAPQGRAKICGDLKCESCQRISTSACYVC